MHHTKNFFLLYNCFLLQGLLKVGDVILEVNGVSVTSPEQLQTEVVKARGDGLQLKVGSPLVDKPTITGRQVDESDPPTSSSATPLQNNTIQNRTNYHKTGNLTTPKFEGQKFLVSVWSCRDFGVMWAPQKEKTARLLWFHTFWGIIIHHFCAAFCNSTFLVLFLVNLFSQYFVA